MGWPGSATAAAAKNAPAAGDFSVKALESFLSGWAEPIEEAVLDPKKTLNAVIDGTSSFVHTNPHVAAAIGVGTIAGALLVRHAYKNSWYSQSKTALGNTFNACYNAFEPIISAKFNILGLAFKASVQSNRSLKVTEFAELTMFNQPLADAARRRSGLD
jgi:hypothetical protein